MQQNHTKIFTDIGVLNTLSKDENFDANKVWNKLEHKLAKKKYKKIYWIWLAASMLILICIPTFLKTKKYNKNIAATNNFLPQKIEVFNTEKKLKISKKTIKNNVEKHTEKQQILILDTLQNIVENIPPMKANTIEIIKKVIVSNSPLGASGKKKLKVVYASDLYEEYNQQVAQKELVKEQPKKSFFKLFENQNKETEETTTIENLSQPSKTFLGFKTRPTATISINENQ